MQSYQCTWAYMLSRKLTLKAYLHVAILISLLDNVDEELQVGLENRIFLLILPNEALFEHSFLKLTTG